MTEVGVHEAKTRLSELLRSVEAGEEILITRGGRAVARLVPLDDANRAAKPESLYGVLAGEFTDLGDWDTDDSDEWGDLFGIAPMPG